MNESTISLAQTILAPPKPLTWNGASDAGRGLVTAFKTRLHNWVPEHAPIQLTGHLVDHHLIIVAHANIEQYLWNT